MGKNILGLIKMTIYALSSGPGISGIAVIRVSGKDTEPGGVSKRAAPKRGWGRWRADVVAGYAAAGLGEPAQIRARRIDDGLLLGQRVQLVPLVGEVLLLVVELPLALRLLGRPAAAVQQATARGAPHRITAYSMVSGSGMPPVVGAGAAR